MAKTAKKISDFEQLIESRRAGPDDVSVYWFVARGSVLKGPFSQNELHERMSAGEVTSFDYAWKQGFHEWRPLGSLPEVGVSREKEHFENYPSLPVPGHSAQVPQQPKDDEAGAPKSTIKKRKDVEVRLRTASKQWVSPRQATMVVLFAIFVSYVTNVWFQNQVLKNVSIFFQNKSAGRTTFLGEPSAHAVAPELWSPIFSAPSYPEIKNEIKLPARIYGLAHVAGQDFKVGEQKVDANREWVKQETQFSEIDPIFVRPVEVSGHLSLQDPSHLRVKQLGEPFLENTWEK